jgi:hypothetical protein
MSEPYSFSASDANNNDMMSKVHYPVGTAPSCTDFHDCLTVNIDVDVKSTFTLTITGKTYLTTVGVPSDPIAINIVCGPSSTTLSVSNILGANNPYDLVTPSPAAAADYRF